MKMAENLVQSPSTPTPRPSSIATTVSERISGMSTPGSSSALSSSRNSMCVGGNPMTTTISTIAMESGQTKIVIALLQSREWLQLKILEMDPYITVLGNTVKEAAEMLGSHEDVLRKLQSKQSPVEELLRQADQLISTQKPRAEVYAAMAESLGLAWKDLNSQLEQRKVVLKLNGSVLREIDSCMDKIEQVEASCSETADSVDGWRELMKRTKTVRKSMLSSFLPCLEEGQVLIDKLEELKSLDSRPDNGLIQAKYAISQVERWLEKLHDRRNLVDERFGVKLNKVQEEIALLELRSELERVKAALERIQIAGRAYGSDGNSARELSTLVQGEVKKIKEVREKTFNVVREVDKRGFQHVSGSAIKDEAFQLIDACNEALNNLEDDVEKLNLSKEFFDLAHETQKQLSGLFPSGESGEKRVKAINDMTSLALNKGETLLRRLGWDNPMGKGVRSAYEELVTSKEKAVKVGEEMEKARIVDDFLTEFNKLHLYLVEIESSLKEPLELGPELSTAMEVEEGLKGKLREIESKQMVFDLPEEAGGEVMEDKVESLNRFMKHIVEITERRVGLSESYVKILEGMDGVKGDIMGGDGGWSEVQDKFAKLESFCAGFLQDCAKAAIVDRGFSTEKACERVKRHVEDVSRRIGEEVDKKREVKAREEEMNRRISKAISGAEEIIYSAYPILPDPLQAYDMGNGRGGDGINEGEGGLRPCSPSPWAFNASGSASPALVVAGLGGGKGGGQFPVGEDPSLAHIESNLVQVEGAVESLEAELNILADYQGLDERRGRLEKTLVDLRRFFVNYKLLSLNLSTVFKNLGEIDVVIQEEELRNPMETEKSAYGEVEEIIKLCREHAEEIVMNIREMEPPDAGKIEEGRLLAAIEEKRLEWDEAMRRKAKAIAARDLQQIERQLGDLQKHLELTRGQYGESLMAARECSANFTAFEETIQILGGKIEKFIQHVDEDMREKAGSLKENWTCFLQMTKERRRLIDLSLKYFTLVNEAETWFKDGSKLLITIARKSGGVKTGEEADLLLKELEAFVKPGEVEQEERIGKISRLAAQLYGEEKRKLYDAMMIKENREILDSLNSMNKELWMMASSLRSRLTTEQSGVDALPVVQVSEAGESGESFGEAEKIGNTPAVGQTCVSISSSVTEKVITKELNTNTLERVCLRGETPVMMEKETQFEELETTEGVARAERDTVTQTVDEKLFEKETQTDRVNQNPPAFTTPLKDIASNEGEKIRFQCVVSGKPEPAITWLKDGLVVTESNSDYKTEFNNNVCSLTIDETFVEDSSIFTCRASNEAGVADTSAKLVVKETLDNMLSPPKFEVPLPESTKLIEGSVNHQFSCLVRGNPLPTVEWFKNEVNVDTCSDYIITFNNGLSVFKFGEVILEDEGIYSCKATNKAGEAVTSTELLVEARSIRFLEALSKKSMARTGHKLKLECRTNIPCEFQWLHDNKIVKDNIKSDATSSLLVINEAFAKDAGHYVVIAKNPKLGENKCSCQVTVKGRAPNETSDSEFHSDMEPVRPKLKMGLEDTEAQEGDKVRLDCVIVGQPEPEVIWYHNGKPVKESKDFQLVFRGDKCSLIIRNVLGEDAGDYRVTAINSAGEVSSSCKLRVLSGARNVKSSKQEVEAIPPKFSKLIEDTMVNEGDEVRMKCSISEGVPTPTVKWFKNAIEIKDKQGYSISSSGADHELKIVEALPEHRGNYMAKASNVAGDVKCFGCLIVKSPLGLESPSTIKKMEESLGSVSSASPTKSRTEVIETSIESSSVVTKRMSFHHVSSESGDKKDDSVSVQDRAAFFNAKESPPEGVTTIIPMVIKPRNPVAPRFVSSLNGVMADEGAVVVLEGQIDGYPDPKIKWTKNDADFDFDCLSKYFHGKVTLEMRNVKITDGGRYCCIAENEAGIASSVADVVIKKKTFPPVFGKRLQAQTIQKNKRIYMEVEVIGTPPPKITWFKDGGPIDTKSEEYEFRTEGNRHILIAPNASREKSGQYMVKASNEAGNAQSIADVIVLDDQRKSPVCAVIFESTVGITEELGAAKPRTLIYETRSSASKNAEKSGVTREIARTSESSTNTESGNSKHIPIIVKTQPTIPSSEFYEPTSIPRPVLESPRLVSPLGKPLQPLAVKVDSISVTAEPLKTTKFSTSSTTKEESPSNKSVKQMTSQFIEQSSTVVRTSQVISPRIDVNSIPSLKSRSKKSETSFETSTRFGSETPVVPPAPRSTPETAPPPLKLPTVPDSVLKSMELASTVSSEISKTEKSVSEYSASSNQVTCSLTTHYPDLVPGPPPEICYTPKSEDFPKKSTVSEKIKKIEEDRRKLSIPDLPGAVRILPPDPSPPVRDSPLKRLAPTLSPSPKGVKSPELSPSLPTRPALVLEPFPFKPEEERATSPRVKPPPPPKPKKFVPGEFRESDYESDFETKIQPVWKPTKSAFVPVTSSSQALAGANLVEATSRISFTQPTQQSSTDAAADQVQQPERESVKKLVKSWPPPDPLIKQIEETMEGKDSSLETQEDIRRRSVREDVSFFEGKGHARLTVSSSAPTSGKVSPSPEALAMDKLWSRPVPKNSKWPPSEPAEGPRPTSRTEPIHYYVSTVSTPRTTPIPCIDGELRLHQTISSTTYESSSSYYEHEQLEISESGVDKTTSPTVITDRGFKPSDAKKAWPPFLPDASAAPKPAQPGWMQGQKVKSQKSFPVSSEPNLPEPGSPPQIGFAPYPISISGVNDQESTLVTMRKSESSFESQKMVKEGRGYPGDPYQVSHRGSIRQTLRQDDRFESLERYQVEEEEEEDGSSFHPPVYASTLRSELGPILEKCQSSRSDQMDHQYGGVSAKHLNQIEGESLEQRGSSFQGCSDSAAMMYPSRGRSIPRFVPSKFIKRDFSESDYGSDAEVEARIKPKWAPTESDTESEPIYRPVKSRLKWGKASTDEALESLGQSFAHRAGRMAEELSQEFVQPSVYKHEERNIQTGECQDPGLIYFKYDFGYEFGVVVPKEGTGSDSQEKEGAVSLPVLHESSQRK